MTGNDLPVRFRETGLFHMVCLIVVNSYDSRTPP